MKHKLSTKILALLLAVLLVAAILPTAFGQRADDPKATNYYLVGSFNSWTTQDSNYKLRAVNGSDEYILEHVALEKGAALKIVDSSGNWYPDGMGNDYSVSENGYYDVSFYPSGAPADYYEGWFKLTKVGDYTPVIGDVDFYLTGTFADWSIKDAYRLEPVANTGEYILNNVSLPKNAGVKVISSKNVWYPSGTGNELIITESGKYNVSFYPTGAPAGYHEGGFQLTKVEFNPGDGRPFEEGEMLYVNVLGGPQAEDEETGEMTPWWDKWSPIHKMVLTAVDGSEVTVDMRYVQEISATERAFGAAIPEGVYVSLVLERWGDGETEPYNTSDLVLIPEEGNYLLDFPYAGEGEAVWSSIKPAEQDHTGADDKVILHCWNWSFDEIRENLPKIKAAGYTAVQTSPAQPHSGYQPGTIGTGDWWMLYQPLGLHIAQADQSWLGGETELRALCDAAHELDIEVIVDVVSNHICNGYNDIAATGVDPYADSQIIATGTDWQGKTVHGYQFEVLPDSRVANFNPELFNEGLTRYFREYIFVNDEVTENTVRGNIGMPDFKTEEPLVQQSVLAYLEELIDAGVDGFRFDAAKHIETPSDGEFASNFWPVIIGGAEEYAESKGKTVWSYGEVLSTAGKTRKMNDYAPYIDMTEISYAYNTTEAFGKGEGAAKVANQLFKDWLGVGVETLANDSLVLMAESHDMYAQDHGSFSEYGPEVINKSWAVIAARADTSALYFARPQGYEYGLNANDPTAGYPVGTLGKCEDYNWMDPEVAAANKFHNAFVGADEDIYPSGNFVVIERWDAAKSGMVIVNAMGNNAQLNITANHMADGTYYDQITGNQFTVSGGKVTGAMGATGIVVLQDTEPTICEHPEGERTENVTEPTCTEPGWTYTYCNVCGQLLSKVKSSEPLGHVDSNKDNYCDRCGEFLGTITVYFVDTNKWIPKEDYFNNVRYHAWNDSGNTTTWPGKDMEIVGRTTDDFGIWKIELNPQKYTKVIFNAGDNGMYQTVELSYVQDAGDQSVIVYTADYDAPDPNGRTYDGSELFYLNAGFIDWWTNDNAIVRVTMLAKDDTPTVFDLAEIDGDIWGAAVPAGTYVSLILSRVDPDDGTAWNETGVITIPGAGNMISEFNVGSDNAIWTVYGAVQAEKIEATHGAVLEEICGHVGYEIIKYYNQEAKVCDCCGKIVEVVEVEPDLNYAMFEDVQNPKSFYMTPVYWAVAMGITNGTDATHFSPGKDCTRGQVVTFLWRALGCPKATNRTHNFTDVKESAYYYEAMLGAVEKGVTTGTDETHFSPNKAATRGQVVTFLWRALGEPKATNQNHSFTDVKTSGYYYDAMLWAVENNITNGTSDTTFSPNKTCTRGQVVTFLYRAVK